MQRFINKNILVSILLVCQRDHVAPFVVADKGQDDKKSFLWVYKLPVGGNKLQEGVHKLQIGSEQTSCGPK